MKRSKKWKTVKTAQPSFSAKLHLHYRLREACLLLTLALSIFILIALCSYHYADPGWSHATTTAHIINAAGRVGAWTSDLLLYFCGYFAYLLPLLISYCSWIFFSHRDPTYQQETHSWPLFFLRSLGCFLIFLTGVALISLLITSPFRLPSTSGGVLGSVLAHLMTHVFNKMGSLLMLGTFFLLGITLLTGLSWLKLLNIISAALKQGIVKIKAINWKSFAPQPKIKIPPILKPKSAEKLIEKKANLTSASLPISTPVIENRPKVLPVVAPLLELNKKTLQTSGSKNAILPKLSLLDTPVTKKRTSLDESLLMQQSENVELRLADFGIAAKVVAVHPGPVVTRHELQLAAGTKVSKITGLVKDLARSLSVISVRVVEVIPGKSVIGLEIPNNDREIVTLQEVLASKQYQNAASALTLALGKDIAGNPVIVDLAKMPHLLVAGTTGSGKSVNLNAMLLSLLYKSSPRQLRLILIDPKMLELSLYDHIPHLLTPVVTDMKDAATALRWCVVEMERRYRLMATLGVRSILGFNAKVKEGLEKGQPLLDPLQKENPIELTELPQIVVIADEFADMMVVVGKKVETLIARLAQKARAAGIHLIFATQRPSVDVITGLIKANIPTRIAFQVSSKVDSRTILDQQGAEQLLGHGDMLYLPPGSGVPVRVHGAYVSDDEVHRVVSDLKQNGSPQYDDALLDEKVSEDPSGYMQSALGNSEEEGEKDPLYDQAVEAVVRSRRVSISGIQRRFKIGYNRAARIVEAMEVARVVSPMESNGNREVLAPVLEK